MHPSVTYDQMKYIEKWGVKISQRQLPELMSLCDIFVVSVSTTIQWAIACGKPVLNYDVYTYRNSAYKNLKGEYIQVNGEIVVENKKDYLFYLKKLTEDKKFYEQKAKEQKSIMRHWGVGDGKSSQRLLKLFDSLTKKR